MFWINTSEERPCVLNIYSMFECNHIRRDPLSIEHYASDVQWYEREFGLFYIDEQRMKNGRGSSSNTLQYECKHKEILCHLNTMQVMCIGM